MHLTKADVITRAGLGFNQVFSFDYNDFCLSTVFRGGRSIGLVWRRRLTAVGSGTSEGEILPRPHPVFHDCLL